MPAGRPSKFKKIYHKSFLDAMKKGHTMTMWCLDNDIAWSTFCRWRKENDEFRDTVEKGLKHAQGFWEKMLFATAAGIKKDTNLAAIQFFMKNRFKADWKDKIEQDINHTGLSKIKVSIGESGDIQQEKEKDSD